VDAQDKNRLLFALRKQALLLMHDPNYHEPKDNTPASKLADEVYVTALFDTDPELRIMLPALKTMADNVMRNSERALAIDTREQVVRFWGVDGLKSLPADLAEKIGARNPALRLVQN